MKSKFGWTSCDINKKTDVMYSNQAFHVQCDSCDCASLKREKLLTTWSQYNSNFYAIFKLLRLNQSSNEGAETLTNKLMLSAVVEVYTRGHVQCDSCGGAPSKRKTVK